MRRTSHHAGVVPREEVGDASHVLAAEAVGGVVETAGAGFAAGCAGETGGQLEVVGQHAVLQSADVQLRVLVIHLGGVGGVDSALGAVVVPRAEAQVAAISTVGAALATQVGVGARRTDGATAVVEEEVAARAAGASSAIVVVHTTLLAERRAGLALETDVDVDVLARRTEVGPTGVLADELVEGSRVAGQVAALAVVSGGSVAGEAAVSAAHALAQRGVHVGASGTDCHTGEVLEEEPDAVDSSAGGAVAAAQVAGEALRVAHSAEVATGDGDGAELAVGTHVAAVRGAVDEEEVGSAVVPAD